jgi:hypothetical protein
MTMLFSLILLLIISRTPATAATREAAFVIHLLGGSEIQADRAWIDGSRVNYERRGFTGSIPAEQVRTIFSSELSEAAAAACQMGPVKLNLNEAEQYMPGAEARARRSMPGASERAIANRSVEILFEERGHASFVPSKECAETFAKFSGLAHQLEEARRSARGQ